MPGHSPISTPDRAGFQQDRDFSGTIIAFEEDLRNRGDQERFITVNPRCFERNENPVVPLPRVRRWLALGRRNVYWMGPVFGKELGAVPPETQFLLVEHEADRFSVVLPLIDGDLRFCLQGGREGICLAGDGNCGLHPRPEALAVYIQEGSDPLATIEKAVEAVARRLGTFRLRREKPTPGFLDHFGWCTWNAFYDKVDAAKIVQGLESWKSRGLLPGLLIIDDGWLDRCGEYLNEFTPSAEAFPQGLSEFSAYIKREFGVRMFGIWHTFQGYWGGINPLGPLGQRFRTVANRGRIRPWDKENDGETDLFLVHPDEVLRFYTDFYHLLRTCGIDFVKVDGQSATEIFSRGVLGRVDVMRTYQQAFQTAALREFGVEVLHCMAHANDVIWHCHSSNAMRSSDDYRPLHEDCWQQQHIQDNAYNSLFIGQIAVPDWDMFQSNREHSSYHAAARALSGGPVYVSDEPGTQNEQLLEKMVWFGEEGVHPLRCPSPALVTRDRVLTDCRSERRLLKMFNKVNEIGLLGLFHVSEGPEPLSDVFCVSDVENLPGDLFAVWRCQAGSLVLAKRSQALEQTLPFMGWELAVVSPVRQGAAVLGLLDKFNAPAGIGRISHGTSRLDLEVLDGGRVGIYSERRPARVEVNGRVVPFEYEAASGLVVATAPARRTSAVAISWD